MRARNFWKRFLALQEVKKQLRARPNRRPFGQVEELETRCVLSGNSLLETASLVADTISLSWSTPQANQALTVNAKINGTLITDTPRTGTLTLTETIGANTTTLATVDVATATPNASGYYGLSVPAGLPSGSHTLKVSYSGDANYGAYNTSLSFTLYNDSLALKYSSKRCRARRITSACK